MRIRFDEQLEQLNEEMINMGNMIEASIGNAVKALMKQDEELAKKTMAGDEKIDRTERKIEELAQELKKDYTIVMVTHNMQQATRISDKTVFFLLGEIIEAGKTDELFSMPKDKRTEDYITGRFG